MNVVGDEKRIQALFHELKLEDQQVSLQFERVWHNARVSRSETRRLANGWLIVVASALAVMSGIFLLSSLRERVTEIPRLAIAEAKPPIMVRSPQPARHQTIARRKRVQPARREVTRDVIALSTWKSPTAIFMQSSAGSEINSLPQLNQAAKELQSFLPANR